MKITNIEVNAWSTGRIMVTLDNNDSLHIALTEEESERIRQIGLEIFQSRQKSIAREIETASPALLADYSEVPAPVSEFNNDDIPF